jgi:hypothetical protein
MYDVVHGSDFVYHAFGGGAERRHRQFKAFFSVQNPAIDPPSRKRYPNWKVRPLLVWMNYIFPLTWLLGKKFSVDEQTIGFQGNHQDKKRITYKAEGDGFQADALCQDGFTFQFYYRNEPARKRKATNIALQLDKPTETRKKKSTQFTDKTLSGQGALRTRLDSTLDHMPLPSGVNSRCSMHRWLGIETEKSILKCKACNVNLCPQCYRVFHVEQDLVKIKQRIRDFYVSSEDKCEIYPMEEETLTTPPHHRQDHGSIRKKRRMGGGSETRNSASKFENFEEI